ncbi:MAG: ABC transporter permease subunit [Lentisphaeria bacterium]|jgi:ABC-type nitrate/sulfonate/bicarbonate transport system permease component|nr:ABC transporter permease subunit [Lentisphaeria bacterium]
MRTLVNHGLVRRLAPLALLLGLWWLVSWRWAALFPGPVETGSEVVALVRSGELWRHLCLTMFRGGVGLLLGLAAALLLGVPCGFLRPVMALLTPLVTAMQSCPPIIWISILLVWLRAGNTVPMLVVFAAVFPACFLNVAQGVSGLDRRLLEMARVYRIPRAAVFRRIVLPGIARFTVASLSFALGITWKVTATAEFFGAPSGVGERIYWSYRALEMPRLFAWTAVIVAVGMVLEMGVVHPLREALDHERAGGGGDSA